VTLAVGEFFSSGVSRPSCGVIVEVPLRSFSRMSWFRVKESVCISRVRRTCSGCEGDLWRIRLECFFRRRKRAMRRSRDTRAREPSAMPIFAPVESPEVCLLGVVVGVDNAAVELGIVVTVVAAIEVDIAVGASVAVASWTFVNCGADEVDVMVKEDVNNDVSIGDETSEAAIVVCGLGRPVIELWGAFGF
jgi:hypothetical protein